MAPWPGLQYQTLDSPSLGWGQHGGFAWQLNNENTLVLEDSALGQKEAYMYVLHCRIRLPKRSKAWGLRENKTSL